MMKRLILVTMLLALVASSVAAETVVYNLNGVEPPGTPDLIFYPGPNEIVLSLPQFDPEMGTLLSVDLQILADHSGVFTFTSQGPSQQYKINYLDWWYEVNAFGGTGGNLLLMPWVTEPTMDLPAGAPPGHFNTPLTPVPDGETVQVEYGNFLTLDQPYGPDDAEFDAFIGSGTLDFQMRDAMVFSITQLGGNNTYELSTFFTLDVTVTYTYDASVASEATSLSAVKSLFD